MAPPLGWWQGPTWLGRALLVSASVAWALISAPAWALGWWVLPLSALQIAPAFLIRDRPLIAARLAYTATALAMAVLVVRPVMLPHWPLDGYLIPFAPVLAVLVGRSSPAQGLRYTLLALALLATGLPLYAGSVGPDVMTGPLAAATLTACAGFALAHQRRLTESATLAAAAEREERIALEERTRIARELHDIVGHHLSAIAVRTDSARHRLPHVDETTLAELADLGTAARTALHETRQLVTLLRDGDPAPHPTITDIPALAAACRAAGEQVHLEITGAPTHLPAAVHTALHRITGECLSNARRHSPGAPIDIRLHITPDRTELTIDNAPPGGRLHEPTRPHEGARTATTSPRPTRSLPAAVGHGLIGIRERALALGGSYQAGPRADGGFQVRVVLPT